MRKEIALVLLVGVGVLPWASQECCGVASITPSNGVFCVGQAVGLTGGNNVLTNEVPPDPCGCDGTWLGPTSGYGWSGNVTGASGTSANLDTSSAGAKSATFTATNVWTCSTNATPQTHTHTSSATGNYTNISLANLQFTAATLIAEGSCVSIASATINPSGRTIVYSLPGSNLGCSINSSSGEITACSQAGTLTVRAADSQQPNCFVEGTIEVKQCPDQADQFLQFTATLCGSDYGADVLFCWPCVQNWFFGEEVFLVSAECITPPPGLPPLGGTLIRSSLPMQSSVGCILDLVENANGPPDTVTSTTCTDTTRQIISTGPTILTSTRCSFHNIQQITITQTSASPVGGTVTTTISNGGLGGGVIDSTSCTYPGP